MSTPRSDIDRDFCKPGVAEEFEIDGPGSPEEHIRCVKHIDQCLSSISQRALTTFLLQLWLSIVSTSVRLR